MRCFVTKKRTRFGNCVSKSNRKTRRKFKLNLQFRKFYLNGKFISFRLSCKGLRIIDKVGVENIINHKKKLIYKVFK